MGDGSLVDLPLHLVDRRLDLEHGRLAGGEGGRAVTLDGVVCREDEALQVDKHDRHLPNGGNHAAIAQ